MVTPQHTKIIACEVIKEELLSILPPDIPIGVIDSDLHLAPQKLNTALQEAIDSVGSEITTIILGYGLCSLALIGLKSDRCTLVIPRVDDCIALALGSMDAYHQQIQNEPGTYYMTAGWIKAGITPFEEYRYLIDKYGQERADFMMNLVFKDYKRLAYIKEKEGKSLTRCDFTRYTAEKFGLHYDEILGSKRLINKMVFGPWDDDFVVLEPGQVVQFSDFKIG